jgi:predicted O-methyltransferase YrrM
MSAWTRRRAELVTELRHLPLMRGAMTALTVAAAGRALSQARNGVIVGLAAGLVESSVRGAFATLARDIRNAEDAALIAPLLAPEHPSPGTWAVEPDFLRLLASELNKDPASVVELGSGVSTLLIATIRSQRGGRPAVSVDHDRAFAERTRSVLRRANLQEHVRIQVAALQTIALGGRELTWYDRDELERALPSEIDLLVVDGPPSRSQWSRWPAVEVLAPRLTRRCVILLDDGRRSDETQTAMRWARDHPNLALFWQDTVKGTWRLEGGAETDGYALRVARRVLRTVHPHPNGFGRWAVRR